jgi:hypothetical protein
MTGRINPFSDIDDPPVFATKPKPEKSVDKESVARLAKEHNFPSREAPKSVREPKRKPRTHRTGRNQQFNAKATPETIQRFYKAADEKRVPLGELLKLGLDALEAIDPLQKVADEREISLKELVSEAVDAVEARSAAR